MRHIFLMMLLCLGTSLASAREFLITSATQMSGEGEAFSLLLDEEENGVTNWTGSKDGFIVSFPNLPNNLLKLSEGEDIVVYLKRSVTDLSKDENVKQVSQPTTLKIEGRKNGGEWENVAYAYFLYRGQGTKEYSSRIHFERDYDELRITATATNSHSANGEMKMSGFNIIKLGKDEDYSYKFADRFHLATDYRTGYEGFKFKTTNGFIDSRNFPSEWDSSLQTAWGGEGKWTKNTQQLKEAGVSMPNFSKLTSAEDKDIDEGERQRTHVVEHELYAVPGDAICLYPFYGLHDSKNFQENFSHWYDYTTGGSLTIKDNAGQTHQLLDFLTDPSMINKTSGNGFFGGSALPYVSQDWSRTYYVYTEQDYIDYVKLARGGNREFNIVLMNDLDFSGYAENAVEPIGTQYSPFCGVFDGRGHTIKNLRMNLPGWYYVGLIGYAGDGAKIVNLNIDESCSFEGARYVGPVGYFSGEDGASALISNIHSEASIVATGSYASGILGCIETDNKIIDVIISNCAVKGNITGPSNTTCIAGGTYNSYLGNVEIINSYFDGIITGYSDNANINVVYGGNNVKINNCFTNIRSTHTSSLVKDFPIIIDLDEELTTALSAEGWKYEDYNLIYKLVEPENVPVELIRKEIRTAEEFIEVCWLTRDESSNAQYHIVLMDDIDFAGYEDKFVPIGVPKHMFSGIFDGGGHVIKNLKTSHLRDWWYVGLIGYASDGAQILNVILDESCEIIGGEFVGIIGVAELHSGSKITIAGVSNRGTVWSVYSDVGGIIGGNKSVAGTRIEIIGCSVSGNGTNDVAQIGITGNSETVIKDSFFVWDNETSPLTKGSNNVSFENCFTTAGGTLPEGVNETEVAYSVSFEKMADELGEEWSMGDETPIPGVIETPEAEVKQSVDTTKQPREYGTVATFLYPRDVNSEDGLKLGFKDSQGNSLFPNGRKEFIIAADFSQSFDAGRNVDFENKIIYEPTIQFRHIFRIKDGVEFAEEFSGSAEKNQAYVRSHKRYVSARANVGFQIRYDSPVPNYIDGREPVRSIYYYKISDSDYRRVCGMNIRVTNVATGDVIQQAGDMSNPMFYSDFTYEGKFGQGTREIEGIKYFTGDAGGEYARFLKCNANKAKPGTYKVELIGKDYNNEPIKVYGSDEDLVVQEFEITFENDKTASVVKDDVLANSTRFKHCFDSELKRRYGDPVDIINFDEYAELEKLIGSEDMKYYIHEPYMDEYSFNTPEETEGHKEHLAAYKGLKVVNWPLDWDSSNYIFGYNRRYDYSMYMLTNHVVAAPYHAAAYQAYSAAENFPNSISTAAEGDNVASVVQGGMYDRLFYDSRQANPNDPSKWKEGYFYYVNAATDPGVMSVLELPGFCPGSAIYISAWVAECSLVDEVANLAFNLTAVLNDGTRIPVHSFVTGYITEMNTESGEILVKKELGEPYGRWMNVYYTFVPKLDEVFKRLPDLGMTPLDVKYELELDNNCTNSLGADYAIDDIEVYLVNTAVYANQQIQLCDEQTEEIAVNIESSFRVLLQNAGLEAKDDEAEGEKAYIFYTILDKDHYDELREKKTIQEALEGSIKMNGKEYSCVEFSSHFGSNNGSLDAYDHAHGKSIDEVEYITFKTSIYDEDVRVGKEYQIILYVTQNQNDPENLSLADMFSPEDNCAKKGVFKINGNGFIKIDGESRSANEAFSVCENQSPVVQVNLWGMKGDEMVELEKNAIFDWYYGTQKDFEAEKSANGIYLTEALETFREYYPSAESLLIAKDTDEDGEYEMVKIAYDDVFAPKLTQEMIDYIEEMTSGDNPKLRLYQSSFVFPPVKLPDGVNETSDYVVAIPIAGLYLVDDVRICTLSTEIKIDIEKRAPMISHGLTQIEYPEYIADVPLRVGLRQLKNVVYGKTSTFNEGDATLQIPIKSVVNQNGTVQSMRIDSSNPILLLVETNDPEYKDLGLTSEEEGTLMEVGEIRELNAHVDGTDNLFSVTYYDDFNFKEGYYYRFRFSFEEDAEEADESVCSGQDVFTIKVVPEYQKWVGNENRNWNNDENWQRVNYSDLYITDNDEDLIEYVADGKKDSKTVNSNLRSYAPLDFTKVIIPRAEKLATENGFSTLYGMASTTDLTEHFSDLPESNNTAVWPEDTSAPDDMETEPGEATIDIQYDMAAYTPAGSDGIKCRPWYANTCEQINFRPNSEILNQHHLTYEKAWIEMEIDTYRWYTLTVPLKEVYAGDMYLPSASAQQKTRLFDDISFSYGEYDRFKPAVYQRGWDKGNATVYELPESSGGNGSATNVAVKADWSNVYNDVTEEFGAGQGFSVKADTSALEDEPENVLFRFPKADTSYTYYNMDGSITGNKTDFPNMTDGKRSTESYRLNEGHGTITSTVGEKGKYFLIGNPFICHLDMDKFLEKNSAKIQKKYWMVTKDMQKIGFSQDGTSMEDGTIAPLQGFFVEAIDDVESLTLSYDETMMKLGSFDEEGSPLRVASENHMITVTAINGGEVASVAGIIIDENAEVGYSEDEDMTVLDNSELGVSATVYSLAGNRAVTCNVTDDVEGIEIGLITKEEEATTLLFEGIPTDETLYLHDTVDDTYTELYDGFEYVATGSISGRLTLVKGLPSLEEEICDMLMVRNGHSFTIHAGATGIINTICITNSQGMKVRDYANVEGMIEFTLDSGIYLIVADDGKNQLVRKVIVK